MFTFQPTSVCCSGGNINGGQDYTYHFDDKNVVHYQVGTAQFHHQVWNYGRTEVCYAGTFWGGAVYHISKVHVGKDHALVLMLPVVKVPMVFSWLLPQLIDVGDTLARYSPYQKTGATGYYSLDVNWGGADGKVTAMSNLALGTGHVCSRNLAVLSCQARDANVQSLKAYGSTAPAKGAFLSTFGVGLPSKSRAEAVSEPVTLFLLFKEVGLNITGDFTTYNEPIGYQDPKVKSTEVEKPVVEIKPGVVCYSTAEVLVPEKIHSLPTSDATVFVPTADSVEEAWVERMYKGEEKSRKEGFSTKEEDIVAWVGWPGDLKEFAAEFAGVFCDRTLTSFFGEDKVHELPFCDVEVMESLDQPKHKAERRRQVHLEGLSDVLKVSTFRKAEGYTELKDPRLISNCPSNFKHEYSKYTLPIAAALKRTEWYGFGQDPAETGDRLLKRVQAFKHSDRELRDQLGLQCVETDFSRFDSTITAMRCFEHELLSQFFGPESEAIKLWKKQLNAKLQVGKTVHTAKGARLSGSPETSIFNSLDNACVAHMALRRGGVNGHSAWGLLGMYGGDDGVSFVDPKLLEAVVSELAMSIKPKIVEPGGLITFLGRYYGELWDGTPNSCSDPERVYKSLAYSTSRTLALADACSLKQQAYWLTDAETPVLSELVLPPTNDSLEKCEMGDISYAAYMSWKYHSRPMNVRAEWMVDLWRGYRVVGGMMCKDERPMEVANAKGYQVSAASEPKPPEKKKLKIIRAGSAPTTLTISRPSSTGGSPAARRDVASAIPLKKQGDAARW